ncbi:IspD/TarI family cytidylyltransferase [Anaplasma phagocytophilum]|nr:IspD/TarI family cytidylyltransferase [Anaplasma phagocytophilum]
MMPLFVVLIVAAGESRRLGNKNQLKQYLRIQRHSVLAHTITQMVTSFVHSVKVVIGQGQDAFYEHSLLSLPKKVTDLLIPPVYGGARRQDSVRIGLESIEHINPEFVIIHDACRPFASLPSADVITYHLRDHAGIVPVLQPSDTISRVENSVIMEEIAKDSVRIVQTPQIYRYKDILRCHKEVYSTDPEKYFSDESSVMVACGMSVITIEGDYNNFKITTAEDVTRAELYMQHMGS